MPDVGVDVWKYLATALGSSVLTGVTAWFLIGNQVVTRPEMVEYVERYSPFVVQRGELLATIRQLENASKDNLSTLESLKHKIDSLLIENAKQTAVLRKVQEER